MIELAASVVGLALLGCPRMGVAQEAWSVISPPQKPGEVLQPSALTVGAAGNGETVI